MTRASETLSAFGGFALVSIPVVSVTWLLLSPPYLWFVLLGWFGVSAAVIASTWIEAGTADETREVSECDCPCVCGAADDDRVVDDETGGERGA